jgi:hypothetical protein
MNKSTRRLARTAGPAAVLTGVAAIAVAALPSTASAAPLCFGAKRTHVVTTARTATITCEFAFTGVEQTFQVPNGVYKANADLIGGFGGDGYQADSGGFGAPGTEVYAQIPVQPHQILYIEVGGDAQDGGNGAGGTGGWNGGGNGAGTHSGGGGGGGASAIETIPRLGTGYLASRLIVAAGGGGGGGTGSCGNNGGGGGLEFESDGGNGSNCTSGASVEGGGTGGASAGGLAAGNGGTGGTAVTTGTNGSNGSAGALGLGGAGGGSAGGGGGAGLYGGGGGGGAAYTPVLFGSGGGGGGGESGSLNPAVRWFDVEPNSPAMVSLTFTQPASSPRPQQRGTSMSKPAAAAVPESGSLRLPGRRP